MSGNQDASTDAQERYWSLGEQLRRAIESTYVFVPAPDYKYDIDQLLQLAEGMEQ